MSYKIFLPLSILWCTFVGYYVYESTRSPFTSNKDSLTPFFEESGKDLKYTYCKLLKEAKKSIFISSYGISDPDILEILNDKERSGVSVTYHNSKQEKAKRKKISGLYHKKILITDDEKLYIGSANCTLPSLSFQGNQLFGFSDKGFIKAIKENSSYENENILFYSLPADKVAAIKVILQSLSEAKQRIYIAMYALTHESIIAQLILAHKRGVRVQIYLDKGMAKGTCSRFLNPLKEVGIPLYTRVKQGLLHHKCALIDDQYITGSTNWSKSGFSKNEETFLCIKKVPGSLEEEVLKFFKNTRYYSKPL